MNMSQQTGKERAYLGVFQEVTRLISMVLDSQQVMDLVVRRLPELLEVDAATIRLLDPGTNTLVLGAAHGLSAQYLSRPTIDSDEAMATIMGGKPLARTDLDRDPAYLDSDMAAKEGIKSVLALPILFQGHIIGLMRLLTKSPRVFTGTEISFAMALAEQIGMAISNARLFTEMEQQVDFLTELRQISQLVNSTLDLEEILAAVVDKLPRIMGMKACTIRLLKPESNRLELVAASGLSKEYLKRGQIKKENSIFKALKGEAVAVFDAESDPRVEYHECIRREGIKSILAVPVKKGAEIIGVLRLLTTEHHVFSASEVNFATAVAEEGGNAIENARTFQKINLLFNQIEENERFLQNILDSLWAQLVVIDTNHHVVMANRRFLEEHGQGEEEILGRSYARVSPWGDQQAVDRVLAEGKPAASVDRFAREDGEKWLERSLTPITDEAGRVEFVIEAVRDITARQLLEKEKCERMKLAGVLEMAGSAAHELNSPLFAALGTAQLLKDDLQDAEMTQDLDMIIRNMKVMSEITKKMITMTGFKTRDYVGGTAIVDLE